MRKDFKHTLETRAKISAANKGHLVSLETRKKLSAALKGKPGTRTGQSPSLETRAKISIALKGKQLSSEHRAKMSVSRTGKPHPHKGHSPSPKTRAAISVAHKGKTLSPEQRAKMSATLKGKPSWSKGKTFSPEYRAKISNGIKGNKNALGFKHSPEARAKISAANTGSRHPQWLGGVSRLPYTWTFNAELKEEVRRRDNYQCQLCGVPQMECVRKLSVHHIDYNKKNSDPVNLVSLCGSCHMRTNMNRKHWTALFQKQVIEAAIK